MPDISKWTPAILAWIGVLLTFINVHRSGRRLRIMERQEQRQRPVLRLYLQDCHLIKNGEDRAYTFLLSVSNPADSDNALARLDLRIQYRNESNLLSTTDVPCVSTSDQTLTKNYVSALVIPANIGAHQTIAGRVFFRFKRALLEKCNVEKYFIIATDSHGLRTNIETALVRELTDETEINKN